MSDSCTAFKSRSHRMNGLALLGVVLLGALVTAWVQADELCNYLSTFGCCATVIMPCEGEGLCPSPCCSEVIEFREADIQLITWWHSTGKCDDYTYATAPVNGCQYHPNQCVEDYASPGPGIYHCVENTTVVETVPCDNESFTGGSTCGALHTCP